MTAAPDPAIFAVAQRVGERLRDRKETVAVAESCTGGLLGAALTDVPGSSRYFLGGVIAYANRVKADQLGVSQAVLERDGAVSGEAAMAMATGVRALLHADIGLSITGVAGPGEEDHKPAGLTFVGIAAGTTRAARYQWAGDRFRNRRQSVLAALDLLDQTLAART
ncbi:MAG TPA: CinA family protein [Candidatus Limnocylindrales bacterium]|nr:CinA family protein [Candidatus Limnocylindrales bacterium]